jgi:hypothetical protein
MIAVSMRLLRGGLAESCVSKVAWGKARKKRYDTIIGI